MGVGFGQPAERRREQAQVVLVRTEPDAGMAGDLVGVRGQQVIQLGGALGVPQPGTDAGEHGGRRRGEVIEHKFGEVVAQGVVDHPGVVDAAEFEAGQG